MIRKSWLEDGPGAHTDRRGAEPFVEVSKQRTSCCPRTHTSFTEYGNESIYGGSMDERRRAIHHAQSHVHRFLTQSVGTPDRSTHATQLQRSSFPMCSVASPTSFFPTPWRTITQPTDLWLPLRLPVKNRQIGQGGVGRHHQRALMNEAASAGVGCQCLTATSRRSCVELRLPYRPLTDTA